MSEPRWDLSTRTRIFTVVALVAALAMTVGWIAASKVRSPADVAAGSRPPQGSVITALVEKRQIAGSVVTRGVVGSLVTVPGIPASAPAGAARAIVTAVPIKEGTSLPPGSVVVEVSGSPVFFLPGRIDPYRDLAVGSSGPDVRQLQRALVKAGLQVTDPGGRYGSGTASAVRKLYQRNGYMAPSGGSRLPMSALVFANTDRATVTQVKARVNQSIADAMIELASGELVVLVAVEPAAAEIITTDAKVVVTAELIGGTAEGVVSQVIAASGDAPARAVVTTTQPIPGDWAGQDVRVEAVSQESAGDLLAVPVSALFRAGDGKTQVEVVAADGHRPVEVTVGTSASGFVAVTPTGKGSLEPGDAVLVGQRR